MVTLPGGLHVQREIANRNNLLEPSHPIMSGIFDPIDVQEVSLASFTSIPERALVITTNEAAHPTLVEYAYGAGLVLVSGHPLEYFYDRGNVVGEILANMIPYAYAPAPQWIEVSAAADTVPAGGSTPVSVTLNAARLEPGTYIASVVVASNDPDEPTVSVPVSLHVRGIPDIAVTPSGLDFGEVFVGGQHQLLLDVSNAGTDVLHVLSIASNDPAVSIDVSSFTLETGESRQVAVTYSPTAAGILAATLTIVSDDPDSGTIGIALTASGLVPPDVAVGAPDLDVTLLHGASAVRTLSVRNTGGSDLRWALHFGSVAATTPRAVNAARVLIVEDYAPWLSTANERILEANGLTYNVVDTVWLPYENLASYALVIIASDQPTDTYLRLAARMDQFATYVAAGGVLEFHAAGWGWNGGNPTAVVLPGGMTIAARFADTNHVAEPDHPVMAGIPEQFSAFEASHVYFENLPPGTTVIGTDDIFNPNVVEYGYGSGRIIASGQTLELSYDDGAVTGTILANMIPWAARLSGAWLSFPTTSGVVPAGDRVEITANFDGSSLPPGDYEESLVLSSNDPDEPLVPITARLHLLRLRADAGADQRLECSGGGGANAALDGRASAHMDGPAAITRYLWSELGRALGEGASLVAPVPLGSHEVALRIEDATGETSDDIMLVDVVDTLAPSGGITSPSSGACLGPMAVPVVVTDSFTDLCGAGIARVYDPPQGGSVSAHGDHLVTLTASDTSGNPGAPASVSFTIDTVPPAVTIVADPATFEPSRILPFSSLFASGDNDGASGGVVHEVVTVDGCVVYDGFTYGDRDGLLGDESASTREVPICDMARACGRRHWTNPVIGVTATDCGGNSETATLIAAGEYLASHCAPATTLTVSSHAGNARLSWTPVQGASGYQVVRGGLNVLRMSGGAVPPRHAVLPGAGRTGGSPRRSGEPSRRQRLLVSRPRRDRRPSRELGRVLASPIRIARQRY